MQHQHVLYVNILNSPDDLKPTPTTSELQLVFDSLVALKAMCMEDGMVGVRKPEGERNVLLNPEGSEVERVLSGVEERAEYKIVCDDTIFSTRWNRFSYTYVVSAVGYTRPTRAIKVSRDIATFHQYHNHTHVPSTHRQEALKHVEHQTCK